MMILIKSGKRKVNLNKNGFVGIIMGIPYIQAHVEAVIIKNLIKTLKKRSFM